MAGHAESAVRCVASGNEHLVNSEQAMEHVRMLRAFALDTGLSADHMLQMSTVVTAPTTRSPMSKSLLHCMVPAKNVTKAVVFNFSGALCSDSISPAVKRDIIQWMAAAYHLFDGSCNIVLLCRSLLRLLDTSLSGDVVSLMLLLASKETATSFTMSMVSKASKKKPSDELLYLAHVLERCSPVQESHKAVEDEVNVKLDAVGSQWEAHMHKLQQELFGRVRHPYHAKELGVRCVGINTSSKQLLEAFERRPPDLMTVLLNPEILKAMASEGKHRQIDYFQSHLRIALNDVFRSPETDKGRHFLKSLASMVGILQENPPAVEQWLMESVGLWDADHYWEQILALISSFSLASPNHFFLCIWEPIAQILFYQSLEMQVNIFQCFTELCRFWTLVEVPRSRGRRDSIFVRTYEKETMHALERLITDLGRVGMALVQLHPNRLVEILLPVFEIYSMRLEVFRKARVIMLCLPEWPFVMLPVFSRNPLLIDGVCKMYLSLLDFLEEAKEHLPLTWLKTKISEYNNQAVWLGLALSGDWKGACAVGPQLSPSVLEAPEVSPSDSYSPLALWWQPALQERISELCRTHNVEPHEIVLIEDTWLAFINALADFQPHTAEFMRRISKMNEQSRASAASKISAE
ncbi:uncharacterized protein LOC142579589 isoform X1 [Dermacentor variabilis]|uniref:uncharacterized protein LOC142579589 isoform X1 n=1 Tax=Dermacentor variabilis TaxID=34621 RepID=UPI003F5B8307